MIETADEKLRDGGAELDADTGGDDTAVQKTQEKTAQAEPEEMTAVEKTPADYYRSQEEVDAAFKKRLLRERKKWEQEHRQQREGQDKDYGKIAQHLIDSMPKLKREYPDIDIQKEITEKPLLGEMLLSGYGIEEAYAFFYPERRKEALRREIEKKIMDNVKARNAYPDTIGSANGSGAGRDISLLSDDEILNIDARVKKGERVVL